jgi:hypothetical protein
LIDIGIEGEFAINGILRVPLDMAEHRRLFAVRVSRNDLLPDMPGGQRVVVDPDDREIGGGGLFMTCRNHQFGPVLIEPLPPGSAAGPGQTMLVYRSRFVQPMAADLEDVGVVGRMVMKLCQMTDFDSLRVREHMMPRVSTGGVATI